MSFFPDRATFLTIGPFSIRWYAILILSGAFFAYWRMTVNNKKNGYSSDDCDNLFVGCLLCGILGARIWYVLFSDLGSYLADPLSIFRVWEGGLAIHGGLIFGFLFGLYYTRKHHMNLIRFADTVFPYVLVAQAVGRWGNFLNQEAFGKAVSAEYFAKWPSFLNWIVEGMYINGSYREPSFFYESMLNLLGFALIMLYKKYNKPKRGDLTCCYFLWYGFVRFWIEIDRSDSLRIFGMKMAMIISVLFMVIGVLGLLGVWRKLYRKYHPVKPVLIFDNDGTLVDTTSIIKESFAKTFEKYKPDYKLSEEELDSFLGPTLEQSFSKYFPAEQVPELVEHYRVTNNALLPTVQALPGVLEMLEKWHKEGYTMACVSAKKRDTIIAGWKHAGIDPSYFSALVGYEDLTKHKPDPEGILRACEMMGVSHDDMIYAGDSVTDVQAAINAGGYAVGYTTDPKRLEALKAQHPNFCTSDFKEIDKAVKQEDISWTFNLR